MLVSTSGTSIHRNVILGWLSLGGRKLFQYPTLYLLQNKKRLHCASGSHCLEEFSQEVLLTFVVPYQTFQFPVAFFVRELEVKTALKK